MKRRRFRPLSAFCGLSQLRKKLSSANTHTHATNSDACDGAAPLPNSRGNGLERWRGELSFCCHQSGGARVFATLSPIDAHANPSLAALGPWLRLYAAVKGALYGRTSDNVRGAWCVWHFLRAFIDESHELIRRRNVWWRSHFLCLDIRPVLWSVKASRAASRGLCVSCAFLEQPKTRMMCGGPDDERLFVFIAQLFATSLRR